MVLIPKLDNYSGQKAKKGTETLYKYHTRPLTITSLLKLPI